ncbi:MAG: sulfate reduction electron transfer complex DsrMKJOP subunit DsrJ [Deltaproteobacteria bacterium]|nr:sulfate reduction electron transfer complex DsrMKJOP subunit DsrJ [Deltaproteobacteria bacterium]
MRDKGRIVLGLLVFLVLATFPVWFNLVSGEEARRPELLLPTDGSRCVEDAETMRTEHMQLLMDWRDEVVRSSDRVVTTADGRRFYKSLSGTCMSCHDQKPEFCDKCHDYVGVTPYCWDCHVVPKGGE